MLIPRLKTHIVMNDWLSVIEPFVYLAFHQNHGKIFSSKITLSTLMVYIFSKWILNVFWVFFRIDNLVKLLF